MADVTETKEDPSAYCSGFPTILIGEDGFHSSWVNLYSETRLT